MTHNISTCPQQLILPKKYHIPEALLHDEPIPEFLSITPESMNVIWPYLQQECGRTCDFSYGGLLMWEKLFHYQYAIHNETLFIKGKLESDMSRTAFSLPIGKEGLGECIKLLRRWCEYHGEEQLRFSAIPEYAIDVFSQHLPSVIKEQPAWADYLYDIIPLATLSGKKMAKKRNHFNKFKSEFPNHIFEALGPNNINDAFELLTRLESKVTDYSAMAVAERKLTFDTLRMFASKNLPMSGGILYANNKPIALTIGDVKKDTLFIHIEKADRDIAGSYEAINKYFASYMLACFPALKYINREDDAGDPGLRKAKESYHPIALLKKYDILF